MALAAILTVSTVAGLVFALVRPESAPAAGGSDTAPAGCPASLVEVGHLGGLGDAFAVGRGYAYLGIGDRLQVVDLARESSSGASGPYGCPKVTEIGLTIRPELLVLAGDVLYMSSASGTIQAYGVGDPEKPTWLGELEVGRRVLGLVVEPPFAYIVSENALNVAHVDDPTRASLVGELATAPDISGLTVLGDHALLWCGDGYIVVDITSPQTPQNRGFAELGPHGDMAAGAPYFYVAPASGGVQVHDATDPLHPVLLGQVDIPRAGNRRLVASRGFVYSGNSIGSV